MKAYREESDSIGTRMIPSDAYYGVQSLRGAENFHITGRRMHPKFIEAIVELKKAAAITNRDVGALGSDIANAIIEACDEMLDGRLLDNFIIDAIQGGATFVSDTLAAKLPNHYSLCSECFSCQNI